MIGPWVIVPIEMKPKFFSMTEIFNVSFTLFET